jgi:hypothetical protein
MFCFIITLTLTFAANIHAAPATKDAKAPKEFTLNPSQSNAQILKALKASREKARITVVLHSGKEYTGKLGEIGSSAFTLVGLEGKDFYDVVISFSHVEAIEVQMRNLP